MITVQTSPIVEKSAGLDCQVARIKICPQAFQLLSSGLYTNKIMAWVRETYCNAHDAHVAAGTQHIPIEVHVPTRLEPHFSVKDFGTGMSHEQMMDIYTTYFDSTKNTSNLEHGGFGLGSKAGLCYNSSFMVSSRFNGIMRSYTVFFDETSMPSISLMGETPTDEPNGLEVSGSVKVDDCYKFQNEMQEFFARVSPLPKFTGQGLTPDAIKYRPIEGTGWKLRAEGGGSIRVNMGIVSYPLSLPHISGLEALQALPLEITCDIGEIDVTVSRESLSLTPASIANLTKRLETIKSELENYISAKMAGCKNMWAARMLMMQYQHGEFSFLSSFFRNMKLLWNGEQITVNDINITTHSLSVVDCVEYSAYRRGIRSEKTMEISVSPHVAIFINDIGRGAISRAKHALREYQNSYKQVYLVTLLNHQDDSELVKALGMEGDTIPRISSMPKPNYVTGTASDKGKAQVLELSAFSGSYESSWDIVPNFDLDNGGVYVALRGYKMDEQTPSRFYSEHCQGLKDIGIDINTVEIIGMKRRMLDKVKGKSNWIELKAYLAQEVKAKLTDPALHAKISDYREYQAHQTTTSWLKQLCDAGSTTVKSILDSLESLGAKIKQDAVITKNINVLENVASRFSISIPTVAPTIAVGGEIENLFAQAPLIKVFVEEYDNWYGEGMFRRAATELAKYVEERLTSANNVVV